MRSLKWVAVAGIASVLLAACGGESDAPEKASGGPPVQADFQDEWDQLIADAQKDGEIVIVTSANQQEGEGKVWDYFSKQFGIKVTVAAAGSSTEINTRVLAEREQGQYTVDLALMGGQGTDGFLAGNAFAELKPQLVHPDILDRSNWHVKDIPWHETDVEQKYVTNFAMRADSNVLPFWYNTDNVTQEEFDGLNSYYDLLDPKWKGRIGISDLSQGEVLTEQARGWLGIGKEFYEGLIRDMDVKVVPVDGARAYTDGLVRGDFDIGMFTASAEADLAEAMDLGLPVAPFDKTLEEGPYADLSGQIGIIDQAPHPAAAKLFVNWMLSKDGQTIYNQLLDPEIRIGYMALRTDVPQGAVSDEDWARTQSPDFTITQDPEAFVQAQNDAWDFFKDTFAVLGIKAS